MCCFHQLTTMCHFLFSHVVCAEGYFLVGVYGINNDLGRIDRWDFDTEAGNWTRTALLEPNTVATQPHFGARIAVSADLVLGTSFENDLLINGDGIGYRAWEFTIPYSSTPPPVAPIHFEAFQFCSYVVVVAGLSCVCVCVCVCVCASGCGLVMMAIGGNSHSRN